LPLQACNQDENELLKGIMELGAKNYVENELYANRIMCKRKDQAMKSLRGDSKFPGRQYSK